MSADRIGFGPEELELGRPGEEARSRERRRGRILAALLAAVVVLGGGTWVAALGTGYAYGPLAPAPVAAPSLEVPETPVGQKRLLAQLRGQQKQIRVALAKRAPKGTWVVIDQTQNRLYLRKDGETILQARCSAGSGMVLKDFSGKRKWVFDTPRGLFRVRNRRESPVWKKPDWAFVEEGKPIPKNDADRFEYGTLGEYAFDLGDGYMIHGTLYERLLGRSVTHGCIRLGRDDLRVMWRNVEVGTPVYIY